MDQAIILSTVNDIMSEEYVYAVGQIVKPSNILYAYKMALDRMCIYLKDKDMTNKFDEENTTLNIANQTIHVKHLVKSAKTLIISNVSPIIPHAVITEKLEQLGLTLKSPMKFLRAGLKNPEYAHVLRARKQVFVQPTDNEIPETEWIKYEDTPYRIYICDDSLICTNCKKTGHKTEKCKLQKNPNESMIKDRNKDNNIPEPTQQSQIEKPGIHLETTTTNTENHTQIGNITDHELKPVDQNNKLSETATTSMIITPISQKRYLRINSTETISDDETITIENSQKRVSMVEIDT